MSAVRKLVREEDSGLRRRPRPPRVASELGVVAQVRESVKPHNRLAAALGALLGGFVPLATFVAAHGELSPARPFYAQLATILIVGGLLFSARTVFAWGKLAFGESAKALGFVVLVEGTMVLSSTPWLTWLALAYLVGVNGIATGCVLALRGRS